MSGVLMTNDDGRNQLTQPRNTAVMERIRHLGRGMKHLLAVKFQLKYSVAKMTAENVPIPYSSACYRDRPMAASSLSRQ